MATPSKGDVGTQPTPYNDHEATWAQQGEIPEAGREANHDERPQEPGDTIINAALDWTTNPLKENGVSWRGEYAFGVEAIKEKGASNDWPINNKGHPQGQPDPTPKRQRADSTTGPSKKGRTSANGDVDQRSLATISRPPDPNLATLLQVAQAAQLALARYGIELPPLETPQSEARTPSHYESTAHMRHLAGQHSPRDGGGAHYEPQGDGALDETQPRAAPLHHYRTLWASGPIPSAQTEHLNTLATLGHTGAGQPAAYNAACGPPGWPITEGAQTTQGWPCYPGQTSTPGTETRVQRATGWNTRRYAGPQFVMPLQPTAEETRAQYLTRTGRLHVTVAPEGGFPYVYPSGPNDHIRSIDKRRLASFDNRPPGTTCMIDVFGPALLTADQWETIRPRVRSALAIITGIESVQLEPPGHCSDRPGWDAPTTWLVWNLTPEAVNMLYRQLIWDTTLASFRMIYRVPFPPTFLFAVLNLKKESRTNEAVYPALYMIMLVGEGFEATRRTIAADRNPRFASPEEGARYIAERVWVSVCEMGGAQYRAIGGPVARIYCETPTMDCALWTRWRDELCAIKLPFANGPIRSGGRCKNCHGVDHTTIICQYNKKAIPGWVGVASRGKGRKGKEPSE
ncbi:hypothetical protein C2E23DRAFT_861276 [Lenzites betulinus]|nr:hypothetical protein C2E23DRAFT_861276 [Lenzites betulinus]